MKRENWYHDKWYRTRYVWKKWYLDKRYKSGYVWKVDTWKMICMTKRNWYDKQYETKYIYIYIWKFEPYLLTWIQYIEKEKVYIMIDNVE